MPLTPFQEEVLRLLAGNRRPDSYLAGGGALHAAPDSTRYSQDLDFFHDSERRVAEAFEADRSLLEDRRFQVEVEYALPGNVRALVSRGDDRTRIDWAHDSAWRFELLKRRGRPQQADLDRLHLTHPIDAGGAKVRWLRALQEAELFVSNRPADELGCLYVHRESGTFRAPEPGVPLEEQGLMPHFGTPGGVLPLVREGGGA